MEKRKQAIKEFEEMKERAELKALSNHSLIEPLTEEQFKRFKELWEKYLR